MKNKEKKRLIKIAEQIYEIERSAGIDSAKAEAELEEIMASLSIADMLFIDDYLTEKFFDK